MDRAAREERRRPQMRPYLSLKVARRNATRASATTVAKWDIGQRNVAPQRRTRTRVLAHRPCRHQAPSWRTSLLDLPMLLLSMISKGMASGWSRKLPSTLHHLQLLSQTHCWAHWTIPRLHHTGRGRKPCWRRNLLGPSSHTSKKAKIIRFMLSCMTQVQRTTSAPTEVTSYHICPSHHLFS